MIEDRITGKSVSIEIYYCYTSVVKFPSNHVWNDDRHMENR